MSFDIVMGLASSRGRREGNEDFAAVMQPETQDRERGWIAALADGVSGQAGLGEDSGGGGGRMAAQTTVTSLVRDYFAVPVAWDTTVALDRLIRAQNAWLADHNRRGGGTGTALTTLSAVVLRGHSYTLAHVGDSRVCLLRGDECTQLTQDHALDQADFSRLTRAIGLDDSVRVDYIQGELRAGDRLLLTSDGVHGVLSHRKLAALALTGEPQACAEALVQAAIAAGGHDNATALLLEVRGLAKGRYEDVLSSSQRLPVAPKLGIGATLDGMVITALVADNGVHRLYQARCPDGRLVAIKALHEARANDPQERAMLAHEGWLGQRLGEKLSATEHAGFVRVHELHNPSAFYLLFDWHGGQTLEQLMASQGRPGLSEFLQAAAALARAVGRLHRAGVVHRDIKPGNFHWGDDGQWRLLDLGVALSGREPEALRDLHAGTPSYINPEQWEDPPVPADAGSDLYALGVTLYQWLTGHLPYGEIEPYQRGPFRRDPQAPSRRQPNVPIWLDHLLLKAVAREAKLRFETADELMLALERGASRPLPPPGATPLARRDPKAVLQLGLGLSVLLNVLLVFWLLFLPK
ncbi:bifunctional protein-serine/threonine kinase/phosphatase [Roseateles koreensis]|uniref:Bifunctional protein-serine/threonine kinase/phosphatase n=1 Tax=Roseateles koreensis TaxID=2987526 RepID=A0ABT5KY22_9BURK|nr:bifunctional protein-serine/threonine kinase/phosphatase [Roseateles koreensis]MDC8786637.1 bifunctional protein-serine/threonine kinase/phosphatase [Roseateles koreensis]